MAELGGADAYQVALSQRAVPLTREDAGNQIISLPWRTETVVRSRGIRLQVAPRGPPLAQAAPYLGY